jgi:transcriptional regulator with XRE-family HTH domain
MIFDLRKIKTQRLAKGLTQKELAALSDVTIQTISTIECGHNLNVDSKTIEKLAKGLKLKPAAFLK